MKAWSYSSLNKFETCAYQYYRTKVVKDIVEPDTEATIWGTKVHLALEERVRDKKPLPDWGKHWEPIAARFDRFGDKVFCERKLALTQAFQPTDFFADDCWYRGVIDLGVTLKTSLVFDYKTGRMKDDHDQLELFAASFMASEPIVESCRTGYIWLKDNKITQREIHRDETPLIWQKFLPRVARLEAAYDKDRWPCKPSGLCKGWCPVKDCEFWRRKNK